MAAEYALDEVLGEDADVTLYRAHATRDGRHVLVKSLKAKRPSPAEYESLRRELEAARQAGVDVAAVPETVATVDGRQALVLRDDGGVPLRRLLDAPLDLHRFFAIAIALGDAVARIHARRMVHGSLHPNEILVLPDDRIELTGFGQPLTIATTQPLPKRASPRMWPYLSPEQTGRLGIAADHRSDLYTLGILFFEMLTGRTPFDAGDRIGWLHAHCALLPPSPKSIVPDVPEPVADIVLKLLAKSPESRYQSASGLVHDLVICAEEWRRRGSIEPFALAEADQPPPLRLPARLYGRSDELRRLEDALVRVERGHGVEILFVSGSPGIGKTALLECVRELAVTRGRPILGSGKCDPTGASVPCGALLEAIDSALGSALESGGESLAELRSRLSERLGVNAPLLVDLLPGLARVIGPRAPPGDVPIPEAEQRLALALDQLLGTFVTPEHPFVLLFLDDLQWADAATMNVLEHWATRPRMTPMLVVGAYRSGGVSADHPLRRAKQRMLDGGAQLSEIAVGPLDREAVVSWISNVLQSSPERVSSLADIVYERSGGNPLFIARFMESLYREGQIHYAAREHAWRWDLEAVRGQRHADDVAELIEGNIATLPAGAHEALASLAVHASSADLDTLTIVLECEDHEVLARLEPAFALQLVGREGGRIRFSHDRIRQIVYENLDEGRRREMHLRIGRSFLRRLSREKIAERVFEVARHFDLAGVPIADAEERAQIAELDLLAGRKAQNATHYESAIRFLSHGISLLDEAHWETHHELFFGLEVALARSQFVTGELVAARELLSGLLDRARAGHEHAAIHGLLTELDVMRGDIVEAVRECLEGLRALGVSLPAHPTEEQARVAAETVLGHLVGPAAVRFAELPPVTDPNARATCDLVSSLLAPAVYTDWNLVWLAASIGVDRSLSFGNASSSALAYATFGHRLAQAGQYDAAFRLGEGAYHLARREENLAHRPRASFAFLAFLSYVAMPVRECLALYREEIDVATSIGDQLFSCYLTKHAVHFRSFAGDPLSEVADAARDGAAFAERARFALVGDQLRSLLRLIHRLMTLDGPSIASAPLDAMVGHNPLPLFRFHHYFHELVARYLLGDRQGARRAAEKVAELEYAVLGFIDVVDVHFFSALALADTITPGAPEDTAGVRTLRAHHDVLRDLAASCPSNFGPRAALVRAELHRIAGEDLDAESAYEIAIHAARTSAQVQVEAIASERAAHFHRSRGMGTAADAYLVQAHGCYESWGALRKARDLSRAFPTLAARRPVDPPNMHGILEAQHAISSALRLPDLHERLLEVALEHAGARRGCLAVVTDDELVVAATAGVDQEQFGEIDKPAAPLSLPLSLCATARRLRKSVVLVDAAVATHRYTLDPYFAEANARSVLCLPIVRKDQVMALLYLENDLVPGAFSEERLGVLDYIAPQAAISLDNARLYERLERENAERSRAEAKLEENRRLLASILDAAPVVVFVKDLEGRYVLINRCFEELFHFRRDELVGKTDYDIYPKESADAFRSADALAIKVGRAVEVDEALMLEDGEHVYISTKFPLQDAFGRVYAVGGIATDVTARKRADEDLRRSLSLVEAAIESTADGILVTSGDGRLVRYNRRFLEMWQIPEEVVRSGEDDRTIAFVLDQLVDPIAFTDSIQELYLDPERVAVHTLAFRDGKIFERYSQPQRIGDEIVGRVWSFRDVTHRVRYAEERDRILAEEQRARADAEDAVRLRDEFLSIASHELRTPLTSLALSVESLDRLFAQEIPTSQSRRATAIARRQIGRLSTLVELLLDVSRIRSGRLVLSRAEVDLRAIVHDVAALLADERARSGSELTIRAADPVIGSWDGLRLEQVVVNLLGNSIKFGRGKPITITVERRGASAYLTIEDDGIGIPADVKPRIFDPFSRGVSARHYGGLGLGLYITRTIVEAHGGKLEVESELEKGSKFIVELPLREPNS